jgi:hypothetical protein
MWVMIFAAFGEFGELFPSEILFCEEVWFLEVLFGKSSARMRFEEV